MAAVITPSLRSALERLKHAGQVNGLLLGWRKQVLLNLLPYEDFRAEKALQTLLDTQGHFASGGDRQVGTLWFAYEGAFALAIFSTDTTLLILHTQASEVDFIRSAALTFLDDTQLLIEAVLNPTEDEISSAETQSLHEADRALL